MRAFLGHDALVEHDDLVGAADGGEAMGHDDGAAALANLVVVVVVVFVQEVILVCNHLFIPLVYISTPQSSLHLFTSLSQAPLYLFSMSTSYSSLYFNISTSHDSRLILQPTFPSLPPFPATHT